MKGLPLALVVVLVTACGGSSSRTKQQSPSAAGATSNPGAGAGESSVVTAVGGEGNATAAGGKSGVAGAGAAGAADVVQAGAAGQRFDACSDWDCLAGVELVYWPDREWQRASASPANELQEADYAPKAGTAWDVGLSSDARSVVLTPRAGGEAVQGTRDEQQTDRAWFELTLPAGGRFVVQAGTPELQAEYTVYGSGVPIVSSTRGVLRAR